VILYMLDTDICSYIIKKRPVTVLKSMEARVLDKHILCISAITYAELRLGATRSGNPQKIHGLITAFCDRLHDVLPWDVQAAGNFAELQATLFAKGSPIGPNDTLIAAHALGLDAVLVTNNHKHFSKVPGLELENWIK